MSDELLLTRTITVDNIHQALNILVFLDPDHIDDPAPTCVWPKLCGESCQFPSYLRDNGPAGFVAGILIQLGYPLDLLKALDCEYEMGEVMHPGVKIHRSRNKALCRIDPRGIELLRFLQSNERSGQSRAHLTLEAFKPRRMVPYLDARRRPWLY